MTVEYMQSLDPRILLGIALVLGLVVGSFLNVVIHRLPIMMERDWRRQCRDLTGADLQVDDGPMNLVVPRSHCPACGHRITALENIPVASYVYLRGRCSACGSAIPARYPLVELASALVAVLVVWRLGAGWTGGAALVFAWALLALAVIDLDAMLLPDQITLPLLWLGLVVNLDGTFVPLGDAVIGAVGGYIVLWLVYHGFRLATGKEGMGYGDFKLLAMIGAWLGWQALPLVILLSSAVGAVVGIALIIAGRQQRSQPLPFGPFIAAAGLIALLWGTDIIDLYLGTANPAPF